MVIKKPKSCLHHKSIYCAGSDAIYANSGRLLFRAPAQPPLYTHPSTIHHCSHASKDLWATAHCIRCSCGDLMVACWRYSADDISIMGLHCRQTHYKPAIRGNTGDSTTHSAWEPKHTTTSDTMYHAAVDSNQSTFCCYFAKRREHMCFFNPTDRSRPWVWFPG